MGRNLLVAVKASGAITANGNSNVYNNADCRGVTVIVKNTAASGTNPTLTVKLQESVPGAGWVDVPGATTAAIAGGTPATTQFTVYPGMTVGTNTGVSRPIGRQWRVAWTVGGTTPSITASIDAILHA